MIAETRDPAIINHFAAHPDISPHIAGPLDFSGAIRNTAVYLFGEHGGFCYEWTAPRTYEAHVMLTEAGRGRWGREAARRSVEMMEERGASHLWARVKPGDRHVAYFARLAGFRDDGQMTLYSPEPELWHLLSWRSPCPQP